jgi:hypothetical protein
MNFSQIIRESFQRPIKLKQSNHIRLNEIFLNEDKVNPDDVSKDVLNKIENNLFEKPNPNSFTQALSKSKHQEMLTDYSPEELSQMKLFKLKGYDIGYALKKYKDGTFSEIVAVFNNEPNIKGIGKVLIKSAIKNGGKHLDHFSGFLDSFYQSLGFDEHSRDKFDPQYDQDGSFRKKYGEADVVYRTHNPKM